MNDAFLFTFPKMKLESSKSIVDEEKLFSSDSMSSSFLEKGFHLSNGIEYEINSKRTRLTLRKKIFW